MQIFTVAFFICALVVASIDNAGFNVVLTGLLLCVWEVGTMWLLKRGPHETSVRTKVLLSNTAERVCHAVGNWQVAPQMC